jgi:hypothetical protein
LTSNFQSMIAFQAVINYSDITGKSVPRDPLALLKGYRTEDILLCLTKLNALLYQLRSNENRDLEILGMVFFDQFGKDAPDITQIKRICKGGIHLFSAQAVAMMMAYCLENFTEEEDPNRNDAVIFFEELFSTVLIFNKLYYDKFKGNDIDSLESAFQFDCMQQGYLRMHPIHTLITLSKFAFLSRFMADHEPLRSYSFSYCTRMGLANPYYFGRFFRDIFEWSIAPLNQGKHIILSEHVNSRLLKEFSLDRSAQSSQKTYSVNMDVVPKPFFPVEKGALVLDYSFFQYSLEDGFIWSFHKNELKDSRQFRNYNGFQGYMGLNYFERFLVGNLLEKIFHRKGQLIISDEKYQDFIIRASPRDIFIFEVKMTGVHGKTLESLDYKEFRKFLDDNFLSSKQEKGKAKGIHQLLGQVDHFCDQDAELLGKLGVSSTKNLNIYPVLICSDSSMNFLGVNYYLNETFMPLLEDRRKSFQSIRPLTVLHVDMLLEYFAMWKEDGRCLAKHIQAYHKNHQGLEKQSTNGDIGNYVLSKRSFTQFMRSKRLSDEIARSIDELTMTFDLYIGDFGVMEGEGNQAL